MGLLAVRPDLQSRGYGRIMASYMINKLIAGDRAQKVKISVIEGNPAKGLYEKLGFQTVRVAYSYIKYYKPESRPAGPEGYADEEEILRELRLYGRLREETVP